MFSVSRSISKIPSRIHVLARRGTEPLGARSRIDLKFPDFGELSYHCLAVFLKKISFGKKFVFQSNIGFSEACVEMAKNKDGKWNDAMCNIEKEFICEMDRVGGLSKCDVQKGWVEHNINGDIRQGSEIFN